MKKWIGVISAILLLTVVAGSGCINNTSANSQSGGVWYSNDYRQP
ncbi:MAG: hypothetical protein ACLFMM_01225 [Methanohalobium sp.]